MCQFPYKKKSKYSQQKKQKCTLHPVSEHIRFTPAKPEIIHNRGRCKLCGDIIESTDRHEFVTCRCGACSVDGGHDYLRRCFASPDYFEELSVIKPCGDSCENASDSNPKSDPDAVIDAAAKRILEEYRDAFTELAKGSDD